MRFCGKTTGSKSVKKKSQAITLRIVCILFCRRTWMYEELQSTGTVTLNQYLHFDLNLSTVSTVSTYGTNAAPCHCRRTTEEDANIWIHVTLFHMMTRPMKAWLHNTQITIQYNYNTIQYREMTASTLKYFNSRKRHVHSDWWTLIVTVLHFDNNFKKSINECLYYYYYY